MKPSDIRIGFAPIARPTFDLDLAREVTARLHAALTSAGYRLLGSQALIMDAQASAARIAELQDAQVDMILMAQASFADSEMVMQMARALPAPLLMWAFPEDQIGGRLRINSFCGINLAAHGLRRAGLAYDCVYAPPDDAKALAKLADFASAAAIKTRLAGARIGRLGENPAGFATCLVNYAGLQAQLGVEIAQFELAAFFERVRAVDSDQASAVAADLRDQLAGWQDVDSAARNGTLSAYLTLDALARERNLAGWAVRCWPEFFTDLGCAACGAMSLLSDRMTPCSCEADVNGTITQLILGWLSGEPAFGSDLVAFDVAADEATLWHCGLAPLSMADPDVQPAATIHSNRRLPLLMQFPLKPGRVTIARLSEATGEFRLVIGGGRMLKAPPAFTGASGRMRFDAGAAAVMHTLLSEGLEHHVSIVYGDYQGALAALARMLGMPVLRL